MVIPENTQRTLRLYAPVAALLYLWIVFTAIIYWPGIFDNDSLDQWYQVITGSFSNQHPIMHTALMAPFFLAGQPGWFLLAQLITLSLTILGVYYLLSPNKDRRVGLWVSVLVLVLNPATGILFASFWKDALYSLVAVAYGALLATVQHNNVETKRIALYIILTILLGTLRHNGLVVLGIIAAILIFVPSKRLRWNTIAGFFICLLIPGIFTVFHIPAQRVSFETYTALHILTGYARAYPNDARVASFLKTYIPQAVMPIYNKEGANWLILNGDINHKNILNNKWVILRELFITTQQNPTEILSLFIQQANIGIRFVPTSDVGIYHYQLPSVHQEYPLTQQNTLIFEKISHMLDEGRQSRPVAYFWAPPTLLIIVFILIFINRNRQRLLVFILPTVLNYAVVLPVLPAQDYRYFLPVFFVFPIILGLTIDDVIARVKRKTSQTPALRIHYL